MLKKLRIPSIALLCVIVFGVMHAQKSLRYEKSGVMTFENVNKTAKNGVKKNRPLVGISSRLSGDETPSKAYGIRVYSDISSTIDLVSFDVTNPTSLSVEATLPFSGLRAAACDGETYYVFETEDGMTPSSFKTVDLATKEVKTVVNYGVYDNESPLIIFDMTWDPTTRQLYAYAYDILNENNDYEDEVMEGEIGLYTVNPATGRVSLVGNQGYVSFISLAVNAQGELYGLDNEGTLWEVNKSDGQPIYDPGYATVIPSALQSMAFDFEDGTLYWSGFSVTDEVGDGFFSRFMFYDDYAEYEPIDYFPHTDEILGLYIDSNPIPAASPAAVTDLTVTRDANGGNMSTLSWVNPSKNLRGEQITSPLKVNIYRNDILVKTLEDLSAGSNASYVDTDVNGMTTYKVAACNEVGEGKAVYSEPIFIGADTPGRVAGLTCVKSDENSYNLTVNWSAPTEGEHNGWFDATTLKYTVVRYPDQVTVAENIAQTTFVDETITTANGYYYSVIPSNAAGIGVALLSNYVISGPALNTPFRCDFSTDAQYKLWQIFDEDHDGYTWFAGSNYAGTKDAFLKYFPEANLDPETETNDWFISAPIHLDSDKRYAIRYSLRILGGIGDLFPFSYNVTYGKGFDPAKQNHILVSRVQDGNKSSAGFVPYSVAFRVDETGDYNFGFQARNSVMAQFTNIVIEEIPQTDLYAVSISGTDSPALNTESDYNVVVKNEGYNEISSYELQLIDQNGNVLASKSISQTIASQQEQTLSIAWAPQNSGQYKIAARIILPGDETAENNQTSALTVNVLEDGVWYDFTDGKRESGVTPFYLTYTHSTSQIIYTKDLLKIPTGKIKGITYYYNLLNNTPVEAIQVKISLANCNTDEAGFDWMAPVAIAQNRFTEVYDGTMILSPDAHSVSLIFDTPFEYTGENLCIMSEQISSGGNSIVRWLASYNSNDPLDHTLLYRGDEPFDFTQELTTMLDLPNISLFMIDGGAGLNSSLAAADIDISVNSKELCVSGNYDTLNIYDLTGKQIATHRGVSHIDMSKYSGGVFIVEVTDRGGKRLIKKIALK